MIQTIYVTQKYEDMRGEHLREQLNSHMKNGVSNIQTAKVYRLEGITKSQAEKLAKILFAEGITQTYSLNKSPFSPSPQPSPSGRGSMEDTVQLEIAYKPGVMNPEVASIVKSAHDLRIKPMAVDANYLYTFLGNITLDEAKKLIDSINLYNPLIEEIRTVNPKTLVIKGHIGNVETIPIRHMTIEQLMELSKNTLFLDEIEMKTIQKYFQKLKRDPTDCELEVVAQTWSEHCVHKTFKANLVIDGKRKKPLFSRIKKTAIHNSDLIVSAFSDNAGVIEFYDDYAICGKVETHNSPSAIEPYGGAMTGSGGVFRDILGTGLGAKPIVSTDMFCLADPDLPAALLPPGCLPPKYILRQVIKGVRDYGNRVGIPTNNGSLHFHNGFRAKPTVAVGAYGLIPKKFALKKSLKPGDFILTLGGRTGRDGIHGATFSSGEMTGETKEVSGTAVQIGNAIEEKRLIDCVLTLRDADLIKSITDCGAGGFSSAIGEMAEKTGAKVYLERVPLKYEGLKPWEIFLSESQERMVIAIHPDNLKKVKGICRLYNVEESVIGEFTNAKKLQVYFENQTVCELSMEFLHNGLPQKTFIGTSRRHSGKPSASRIENKRSWTSPSASSGRSQNDMEKVLKHVLAHPTIASKEPIVRLYDHNVKGSNALHPFGGVHFDSPNDGSIVKPLLDKPYGFVTTHGINPSIMEKDVYLGSVWAITEAVSNFVAIGGDVQNAALIDNFIWPFPDEESLADLDRAVDACFDMAKTLKMPFVSGKDSLSSTYRYPNGSVLKIPPVLLISVFGKIPDVKKTISSDFKKVGSTLVLLGNLDIKHMGGSIYGDIQNIQDDSVPHVDVHTLPKLLSTIHKEIQQGAILSCHDISEGGLGVGLSEMCFGADFGCVVDLEKISSVRPDYIMFNETTGTFVVEVENEDMAKKAFKNIPHNIIGKTKKEKHLTITHGRKTLIHTYLSPLKNAWQKPMREIFQ